MIRKERLMRMVARYTVLMHKERKAGNTSMEAKMQVAILRTQAEIQKCDD